MLASFSLSSLLAPLIFSAPPAVDVEGEQAPPAPANVSTGRVSFTVGIWTALRGLHMPALDAALRRDGFSSLPSRFVTRGFDMEAVLGRARFGLGLGSGKIASTHSSSGAQVGLQHSLVGVTTGYEVLQYRTFAVFAATGIYIGSLEMNSRTEGLTLFPDLELWEGDRVESYPLLLPLELGLETMIPLKRADSLAFWGLQVGTRIGWMHQLGGASWRPDHPGRPRNLGRDPAVDLSGPSVRFIVGIGAASIAR